MTTLDLRSGGVDIRGHVGDDLTITATIVDSNGDAVDVSGYTISADVLRDGTSIASFSDSVGGAGNNVVTLTLSDTQTTTIGIEAGLRWSLSMTTGGTTRQYVGGAFRLSKAGDPNASSATSVTVTTEGAAISVTVAAAAGGGASALDDLNDVTITTPSNGEVLKYNGSIWVNDTDATAPGTTGLDDLSDVAITTAAEGDILRRNATEFVNTPGTTHYEAAGAVAAHEADTTNVHGIADTSALLDTADIGVSVQAYSAVLDATTASFTTADESKLDGIEASADVTDAANVAAAGAVMASLADAKGDLFVATADNTVTRLPVGTNDYVLTADSAQASGVKWAAASGGATEVRTPYTAWPTARYLVPPHASTFTVITSVGRVYATPVYIPESADVDRITIEITSVGTGNGRLAIFDDRTDVTGWDHFPNQALVLATIDTTSTGIKEATISLSLSAGWHWLAFLADTAGRFKAIAGNENGVFTTATANDVYSTSGSQGGSVGIAGNVSSSIASVGDSWSTSWSTSVGAPLIGLRRA